jgi:hypothetical protein
MTLLDLSGAVYTGISMV